MNPRTPTVGCLQSGLGPPAYGSRLIGVPASPNQPLCHGRRLAWLPATIATRPRSEFRSTLVDFFEITVAEFAGLLDDFRIVLYPGRCFPAFSASLSSVALLNDMRAEPHRLTQDRPQLLRRHAIRIGQVDLMVVPVGDQVGAGRNSLCSRAMVGASALLGPTYMICALRPS